MNDVQPTADGVSSGTRISRRTLAAGAAWAVPTVALAAAAPAYAASGTTTTTTTLLPCVSNIGAVGGTYPVTYGLSGCTTADSHWDFRFDITAALGGDCTCPFLRVTFFDNPKRSRLWISGNLPTGTTDWSTNTGNSPRLWVQKVIAAGATARFPDDGDVVRRVVSSPYTGYDTGGSTTGLDTGGTTIGPITATGTNNDALHALFLPNGAVPCNATGPMAFYRVECGPTVNGPWTQLGDIEGINPPIPMIQSTVCVVDTSGNDRYRLGVSVLTAGGLPLSSFKVTDVRRNSNTNTPNDGSSVYSGPDVVLGAGTTNVETTSAGSGSSLWIEFTTDNGTNTSWIRVDTNSTNCPTTTTTSTTAAPLVILSATNEQASCPTGNRTIAVTWTGTTTKIQYRVANSSGNFSGNWTDITDTASPGQISLSGNSKCRAVQVRLCAGGSNQTCTNASSIVTVPAPGQNFAREQPPAEETSSVDETPAVTPEPSPTETTESTDE